MWDVLVKNLDFAFAPKGRGNAEIVEAFHYLSKNMPTKFSAMRASLLGCTACGENVTVNTMTQPVLYYTQDVNSAYLQNLAAGICALFEIEMGHQLQRASVCPMGHPRINITNTSHLPDFLMLSLGLTGPNSRNEQKPQLVIPEMTEIFKERYTLVGAVQMGVGGYKIQGFL